MQRLRGASIGHGNVSRLAVDHMKRRKLTSLITRRVIMGANIAGIYGAQIFRQDDRPRYRRGFSINIGVLTFGLALATVRFVDDWRRRKNGKGVEEQIEDEGVQASRELSPDGSEKSPSIVNEKR
jgi:hypothetical protein